MKRRNFLGLIPAGLFAGFFSVKETKATEVAPESITKADNFVIKLTHSEIPPGWGSGCRTDRYGTKRYYNSSGELHRNDGPAVEGWQGSKEWFINGIRHREDGPAIEFGWGEFVWYKNGERHRDGGPAHYYSCGDEFWYQNGERHREDGPAITSPTTGWRAWYLYGYGINEEQYDFRIPAHKWLWDHKDNTPRQGRIDAETQRYLQDVK
jgi:hypothetical protein